MEKGRPHIVSASWRAEPAQAHAQFVSNMVDHEMNIQAALEAPPSQLNFTGCDVMIEGACQRMCARN